MPSQRKRIGFLPSSEVQKIIDKICNDNKLSQSKVTGILVEEALNSRGVLKSSIEEFSKKIVDYKYDKLFIPSSISNREKGHFVDSLNLNDGSMKDEVQMINDFIEFKFFKNIMNKKKFNK